MKHETGRPREEAVWKAAMEWVDGKRRVIVAHVRRYQVHTAYDHEDFVHQAYITAFETLSKIGATGRRFEQHFWMNFKHACFKVSIGPSPDKLQKADLVSGAQSSGDPSGQEAARQALGFMTKRERQVWKLVLDGAFTQKEIARRFGLRAQQRVKILKRKGMERARRVMAGEERELAEAVGV